jgi:hypothetical protein
MVVSHQDLNQQPQGNFIQDNPQYFLIISHNLSLSNTDLKRQLRIVLRKVMWCQHQMVYEKSSMGSNGVDYVQMKHARRNLNGVAIVRGI